MSHQNWIDFFTHQLDFQKKLPTNLPKASMVQKHVVQLKILSSNQLPLAKDILATLEKPDAISDELGEKIADFCKTYQVQKQHFAALSEFISSTRKHKSHFEDIPMIDFDNPAQKKENAHLSKSPRNLSDLYKPLRPSPLNPSLVNKPTFFKSKTVHDVRESLLVQVLVNQHTRTTLLDLMEQHDKLLAENIRLRGHSSDARADAKKHEETLINELSENEPMSDKALLEHQIKILQAHCATVLEENNDLKGITPDTPSVSIK